MIHVLFCMRNDFFFYGYSVAPAPIIGQITLSLTCVCIFVRN